MTPKKQNLSSYVAHQDEIFKAPYCSIQIAMLLQCFQVFVAHTDRHKYFLSSRRSQRYDSNIKNIYCLPSQVVIFCPVFLTASKTIKDLARQNTYRVNLWHQPYMTSVGSRFCKNKISQNIGKLLGTCMHIFKIINLVFLRAVAFGFSFHTKKTLSASLELKQVVSVNYSNGM